MEAQVVRLTQVMVLEVGPHMQQTLQVVGQETQAVLEEKTLETTVLAVF
jgi:hypothetical protein